MSNCCNTSQTPGCGDNQLSVQVLISTKQIEVQLDSLAVVLNDLQVALNALCDDEGNYLELISGVLSDIIQADSDCCNLLAGKLTTLKNTITNSVNVCEEFTTTTTEFSQQYPCGIYRITNNTGETETIYFRECGESMWLPGDVNPGILEFAACYELLIYSPLLVVTLIEVCTPTTTTSTSTKDSTFFENKSLDFIAKARSAVCNDARRR